MPVAAARAGELSGSVPGQPDYNIANCKAGLPNSRPSVLLRPPIDGEVDRVHDPWN